MDAATHPPDGTVVDEAATAEAGCEVVLRLYVAGHAALSARAIDRARTLCESHLKGRYRLSIVDLYQQTELAESAQIVAVPALVKLRPGPQRRLVGDLSDTARVLEALGLDAAGNEHAG